MEPLNPQEGDIFHLSKKDGTIYKTTYKGNIQEVILMMKQTQQLLGREPKYLILSKEMLTNLNIWYNETYKEIANQEEYINGELQKPYKYIEADHIMYGLRIIPIEHSDPNYILVG
jgi:hypothetical protein